MVEKTVVFECESDFNILTVLNLCISFQSRVKSIILIKDCFRGAEKKASIITETLKEYNIVAYSFDSFSYKEVKPKDGKIKGYYKLLMGTRHSIVKGLHFLYTVGIDNVDEYWFGTISSENIVLASLISKRNKLVKMILYEEGIGFYGDLGSAIAARRGILHKMYLRLFGLRDVLSEVDNIYCYRPQEVLWKSFKPVKKLPEISKASMDIINKVFSDNCNSPNKYDNCILYMNQPFKNDGIDIDDKSVVRALAAKYGARFKVKLHPRMEKDCYGDDIEYICDDEPWELTCCKENFNNTVLITVSSQSVLMPFLLFKKEIKTVFLYHLFDYVDDVPGRPYIENNIESKGYSFCSFPKDLNCV